VIANGTDETQVKAAKAKEKQQSEIELDDYRFLLQTKQGRRVFWKLLTDCGVFKTSFTGNSQTFFLEGQRNIGLKVLNTINEAMPEAYLLMMNESKEKGN
jgi:hypothetical protein